MYNSINFARTQFWLFRIPSATTVGNRFDLAEFCLFIPQMASCRPILFRRNLFEWPLRFSVASWTFCSICGSRQPIVQRSSGLGVQFDCPRTIVSICKSTKKFFFHGCRHDSYRQRDLETNGVAAMHEVQPVLDWRRRQRTLWNLDEEPTQYETMACYAQPQRADWPVYDSDRGVYVEWSQETSRFRCWSWTRPPLNSFAL